jgi:hypothetical protein
LARNHPKKVIPGVIIATMSKRISTIEEPFLSERDLMSNAIAQTTANPAANPIVRREEEERDAVVATVFVGLSFAWAAFAWPAFAAEDGVGRRKKAYHTPTPAPTRMNKRVIAKAIQNSMSPG